MTSRTNGLICISTPVGTCISALLRVCVNVRVHINRQRCKSVGRKDMRCNYATRGQVGQMIMLALEGAGANEATMTAAAAALHLA